MKQFLLDTNCIISFITDRNLKQQNLIQSYFDKASRSEVELLVLEPIKFEIIYVLDKIYKIDKKNIRKIIIDLYDSPSIESGSSLEINSEMNLWPEKVKDYADSILAQYSIQFAIPILTFDYNFSKQLSKQKIKHVYLSS